MITIRDAAKFNVPAFIVNNNIVNENGVKLTFDRHKFLIKPYMDRSPRVVARKCGQVGFSTLAIIRSIHLAKYTEANIIYTLPSRSAVKDFVAPKVNPLISHNPVIGGMMGKTESTALKQIGDRFVYFRGSWEEGSAISISAHVLIMDEVDRSNQKVLRTYRTRLDAAKLDRPDLGWEWRFSNPSISGFGVDDWWEKSDKKHWMIKCSRCNKWQFLDFPDNVDLKKSVYICKFCKRDLSDYDRINGQWVSKRPGQEISGYWYNQMMAVWVPASKIIEESQGDPGVFHNFTLGKPYDDAQMTVTRDNMLKCCAPGSNPQTENAMGVDVKATVKHYVIGNKYGIFKVGTTESWQEIERLRNMYGAICVIDHMPVPGQVERLVKRYGGKVYAHNYRTTTAKDLGIIQWGEKDKYGMVSSDRTKIIDLLVSEINNQELIFNLTHQELDNHDYIKHWLNIYRTTIQGKNDVVRPVWEKKSDEDFVHATVFWRIALTRTVNNGVVTTPMGKSDKNNPTVGPDNSVPGLRLDDVLSSSGQKRRGWRGL